MKTEKIKKLIEWLEGKMGEYGDSDLFVVHKSDWEQFKKELNYILENGKEQEDEN